MASQPDRPITGTAKRARERKQRCLAGRVPWITDLYQAAASHHTARDRGGGSGGDSKLSTCSACTALEQRVSALEHRLDTLSAQPTGSQPAGHHTTLHAADSDFARQSSHESHLREVLNHDCVRHVADITLISQPADADAHADDIQGIVRDDDHCLVIPLNILHSQWLLRS